MLAPKKFPIQTDGAWIEPASGDDCEEFKRGPETIVWRRSYVRRTSIKENPGVH